MSRQVEQVSQGGRAAAFDRSAFRRAKLSMANLQSVLPPVSVNLLAQEVISRLAARAEPLGEICDVTERFAEILVSADDGAAMRFALKLLGEGMAVETLYLVHFAGAARLLGKGWEEDRLSSAQVTISASRIYLMMRGLGGLMAAEPVTGRHAVLSTVPNEQHTLGVTMAADLLRREGWNIDLRIGRDHGALVEELSRLDFALLGLSAARPDSIPALARLVAAVRVMVPHVKVVIAGNVVAAQPDIAMLVDADAAAVGFADARDALDRLWMQTG
jgi:methanogenic corrinoid protein MtbC1